MLQILEYLEAYTEHFGFGKSIIFRTEVLSVVSSPSGSFTVSTRVSPANLVLPRTRSALRAHLMGTLINPIHLVGPSKGACRLLGMVQTRLLREL